MNKLPTTLNLDILIQEVEKLHYMIDGTKTTMAYGQSAGLPDNPILRQAADEIAAYRGQAPLHMMVNRQPAGVVVPWHCDFLKPATQGRTPRLERWHLPLITNPEALWEDLAQIHMGLGYWWGPVPYWKLHRTLNLGSAARIHLIVDLDSPEPLGEYE